jgi:hypothetical protein
MMTNGAKFTNWLLGGVVEEHGITACNQYPSTGVFFTNIVATDTFWTVSPSWTNEVNSEHAGPSCGFNVTSGPTSVSLYHNPPPPPSPLSVTINGPSRVRPNYACMWTAVPSGGARPISYTWNPSGTQEDSTVVESFSSSGILRVYATDSLGQFAQASLNITVAQNAPVCPSRPVP